MKFRSDLEKTIKRSVKELYGLDLDPALFSKKTEASAARLVEHPRNEEFGDYATGVALTIASKLKADSLEVASQLKESLITQLLNNSITQIDVAPPGFINFWLSEEVLLDEVERINKLGGEYGKSKAGKGKTVIIDYSSPNIAKPFGIGHLRSTIIGQALYNLYSFAGWRVIGENFLGDWGTQFGKLIYAMLAWGDGKGFGSERPIEKLEKLYIRFHQEAAKDSALEEKAREWFKKLEDGDEEAVSLWKKFREWSIKEFHRIYKLLGVEIDKTVGESDFVSQVPQVIEEVKAKNLAVESEGALIIPFDRTNRTDRTDLPPLMLLKSDGATTYESRDLAAIKARKKKYQPDLYIYETGVEQALHFKKLFLAAEMLGYGKAGQFVHVGHGLYHLPEGKISTRWGRTIHLEEVLEEAIRRARKIVGEKNPDLPDKEKEKVARAVGIGAVKYNDLSQHYSTEIVFDWGKMLSLEGNSAPYLQYTYARARSVLRKAQKRQFPIINFQFPSSAGKIPLDLAELRLLRYLYRFPEVLQEATIANSPNLVCNFLFELAQRFNAFYARVPIIRAEPRSAGLRLALTAATAHVIKNGLTLLGIETLERL